MRFLFLVKDHPGIALVISTLALALIMVLSFDQAAQIRRSHELRGEIIAYKIEYRSSRRSGSRSVNGYYPVVAYALPGGQRQERTVETLVSQKPAIGGSIPIYVDPKHPARGVLVKDFGALWGTYMIAGLIGALAFAASAFFYATSGASKPRKLDAGGRDRLQEGIARYQAGDIAGAIADLSLVLDQVPSGMAYEWRGDAHARLGDRQAAAADYRAAVRMYRKENHEDNLRRASGKVAQAAA